MSLPANPIASNDPLPPNIEQSTTTLLTRNVYLRTRVHLPTRASIYKHVHLRTCPS